MDNEMLKTSAGIVSRWKNKLGIKEKMPIKIDIARGRHNRAEVVEQKYPDGSTELLLIIDPRTKMENLETVIKQELVYFWVQRLLLEEWSDAEFLLESIILQEITKRLGGTINSSDVEKAIKEGIKDIAERISYLIVGK